MHQFKSCGVVPHFKYAFTISMMEMKSLTPKHVSQSATDLHPPSEEGLVV